MRTRPGNLFIPVCAALLFIISGSSLRGQNLRSDPAFLPKAESPDKSLTLSLLKNPQKLVGVSLVSLKGNRFEVTFPLSAPVRSWNVQQVQFSSPMWTDNSSAVALMISDGKNGEVYACAKLTNGMFKAFNLTGLATRTHLGVMGRPATDFIRSEHTPVEWGNWTAQHGRIIDVRSRFWDKENKRYSITGPYLIGNNGELGSQ